MAGCGKLETHKTNIGNHDNVEIVSPQDGEVLTYEGATSKWKNMAGGAAGHARQHSITSTLDHTSTATPERILKADANGLPVNASSTDAEVADAVAKRHSEAHTLSSHTTRAHNELTDVTPDQHHARSHDHSLSGDGSPIAVSGVPNLPASKITSERFPMARMPDGIAGRVLTAQGGGADPAYVPISAAPPDASYITTQAEAGLSNEKVLGTEIIMQGTDASKPSPEIAGRLYFAIDTGILYRDTGSAWQERARAETAIRLAQLTERSHASLTGITATQHHNNANDPTSDQKAALAGTSGAPSDINRYVTNADPRNSDARTPLPHNQGADTITTGTLDGDRLPAMSTTKRGGVPATGTPSGRYLKDDGTWDTPAGGTGLTHPQVMARTIFGG